MHKNTPLRYAEKKTTIRENIRFFEEPITKIYLKELVANYRKNIITSKEKPKTFTFYENLKNK